MFLTFTKSSLIVNSFYAVNKVGMVLASLQVFVLVLLPQMSNGETGTCPSSYLQSGFQLQGHVIKKLSTTSRSACMRECKLYNQCYSINYHNEKRICELNDANHLTDPQDFVVSQGYDYENNNARFPLHCSIKYCNRKTDKCLIDRNGNDYQCLSYKDDGDQEVMTFPQENVENKVLLEHWFESLIAFTVCSWTQPTSKTYQSVFSYATTSHNNEIFILIEKTSSKTSLRFCLKSTCNDGQAQYPVDGNWHHFCLTWSNALGDWKIYIDGAKKAEGKMNKDIVIGKGAVVLGQDQDTYKGGYNLEQSYQGNLTNVNLWNRVLTAQQVADLSQSRCTGEGNVIKWSDFTARVEGDIQLSCEKNVCGRSGGLS